MGQAFSTDSASNNVELLELSRDKTKALFIKKCKSLFTTTELATVASKTNITKFNEKYLLTPSDLGYLLQISPQDNAGLLSHTKFNNVCQLIYESCQILGSCPFLRDIEGHNGNSLSMDDLIVSSVFHTGKYKQLGLNCDYNKLLFISLTFSSLLEYCKYDGNKEKLNENVTVNKPINQDNPLSELIWGSLNSFVTYDNINIDDLYISAANLHQLLTLLLIIVIIPQNTPQKISILHEYIIANWNDFEKVSLSIIQALDINVNTNTLLLKKLKYSDVVNCNGMILDIVKSGYYILFQKGFTTPSLDTIPQPTAIVLKFMGSKLMNGATVSCISAGVKAAGSGIQITTENLIRLYIGKEAGFSMRSLELKILKWQAPTIFIVSGKRIRNKVRTTNKRYLQFDSEYPRYFRAVENHLKPWQNDHDTLSYAVLVTNPWKVSNKRNFGDSGTIIFSLNPHFDYFKASSNSALTKLVYFNTLGMGIGFGNDQPINKNGIRKYLPGDISLTVEPNLEFAVFRHINTNNTMCCFQDSPHPQLHNENYEDRFIITDLEVWGIGSIKELDEQRKQWQWEQKQAEARRNVNINTLAEDRAFLEMVGLVGNQGSGGSI